MGRFDHLEIPPGAEFLEKHPFDIVFAMKLNGEDCDFSTPMSEACPELLKVICGYGMLGWRRRHKELWDLWASVKLPTAPGGEQILEQKWTYKLQARRARDQELMWEMAAADTEANRQEEYVDPRVETEHAQRIRAFMEKARQECPVNPVLPSAEVRLLRARLILEEAFETIEALGVSVAIGQQPGDFPSNMIPISKWLRSGCKLCYESPPGAEPDLTQIVDGCCDLSVVTIGCLIACGVSDAAVLKEVDENNLAKFGPGGYRDEGGKWIKPPDHKPPDIQKILDSQTVF